MTELVNAEPSTSNQFAPRPVRESFVCTCKRQPMLDVHRTLGGMILRGERQLTLTHVRTLAKHFSVSADLFLD